MKTFTLPGTQLTVPAVITGMMRIQDKSDEQVRALFDASLAAGINFFDHADIYGSTPHGCERRFAEALRLTPAQRGEIILQTKAGIANGGYDFSYEHLMARANGSLAALGTDYLDIFLLHRPDSLVEPEEVARAFDDLAGAGKVRHFGVSNHTPGQVELLRRHVRQPLVIDQVQLSITHAPIIAQGIGANMAGLPESASRDLGLLDYARLNGITLQAWSPFQSGRFPGVFLGSADHAELNAVIDRLAGEYQVAPEAIATAWITSHPAQLQVVLGTTTPARVSAAAAGAGIQLTRAQWYELFRAGGHTVP